MTRAEAPSRELLQQLVVDFYSSIRSHTELGPIFAGVIGKDWSRHLQRMTEFWCTVMLGSHTFKGNVFQKHMVLEGIRPEHFVQWLSLWSEHVAARFDDDTALELRDRAEGIARNLFYGLFGAFPVFEYEGWKVTGYSH
jgi:hemoglobin